MNKENELQSNINLCWKPVEKTVLQKTAIGSLCRKSFSRK